MLVEKIDDSSWISTAGLYYRNIKMTRYLNIFLSFLYYKTKNT